MTNSVIVSDQEVQTFREGLEAEKSIDCKKEMIKARLQFAESGTTEARTTYVFYLLKSESELDLNNAQFHLLEMLAQEPLDRDLLYSLALAQFKLGEYGKCRETLAAFFDVPASEPKGDAADKEQQTGVPTVVERKAACLDRICNRAARNEKVLGAAVAGAALTTGLAGLALGGMLLVKALKK